MLEEQQVWLELARRFRNPIDGRVYCPETDDPNNTFLCCHLQRMRIPHSVRESMLDKIEIERQDRIADGRLDGYRRVVFGRSITERAEFCERMARECPECWDKLDPDMWVPKEHWLTLLWNIRNVKVEDGFGSRWSIVCPSCDLPTMQVVRPGKTQCGACG